MDLSHCISVVSIYTCTQPYTGNVIHMATSLQVQETARVTIVWDNNHSNTYDASVCNACVNTYKMTS